MSIHNSDSYEHELQFLSSVLSAQPGSASLQLQNESLGILEDYQQPIAALIDPMSKDEYREVHTITKYLVSWLTLALYRYLPIMRSH
jgi:hypothetical protein